jgi:hypothetical protein
MLHYTETILRVNPNILRAITSFTFRLNASSLSSCKFSVKYRLLYVLLVTFLSPSMKKVWNCTLIQLAAFKFEFRLFKNRPFCRSLSFWYYILGITEITTESTRNTPWCVSFLLLLFLCGCFSFTRCFRWRSGFPGLTDKQKWDGKLKKKWLSKPGSSLLPVMLAMLGMKFLNERYTQYTYHCGRHCDGRIVARSIVPPITKRFIFTFGRLWLSTLFVQQR